MALILFCIGVGIVGFDVIVGVTDILPDIVGYGFLIASMATFLYRKLVTLPDLLLAAGSFLFSLPALFGLPTIWFRGAALVCFAAVMIRMFGRFYPERPKGSVFSSLYQSLILSILITVLIKLFGGLFAAFPVLSILLLCLQGALTVFVLVAACRRFGQET